MGSDLVKQEMKVESSEYKALTLFYAAVTLEFFFSFFQVIMIFWVVLHMRKYGILQQQFKCLIQNSVPTKGSNYIN